MNSRYFYWDHVVFSGPFLKSIIKPPQLTIINNFVLPFYSTHNRISFNTYRFHFLTFTDHCSGMTQLHYSVILYKREVSTWLSYDVGFFVYIINNNNVYSYSIVWNNDNNVKKYVKKCHIILSIHNKIA